MARTLIAIFLLLIVLSKNAEPSETKDRESSAESTTIIASLLNFTQSESSTVPSVNENSTQSFNETPEPETTAEPTTMIYQEIANSSGTTSSIILEYEFDQTQTKPLETEVNSAIEEPSPNQTASHCPSFENVDRVTQMHFSDILTHPCRFDRIERPRAFDHDRNPQPVKVYTRAYVYFLQNLHAYDLQFKVQALLQLRYTDSRLEFKGVGSKRKGPIVGEEALRKKLWVPHIFFANEKDSGILGTYEKDILTTVSPDGTVVISTRFQATLFCSMDLRKFPFDQQQCKTVIESWTYNATDLKLEWETENAVTMGPDQHLTEYALVNYFTNETMIEANFAAFSGNYSSLSFTVTLKREIGFYMYDYYLPSMMIIAISWASFWLQADQTAPRIMLGTTTMLTFITLASAQDKSLPKVSYIKASEIWSMGCTAFIFMSLVEFAFVNTVWRQKNHATLKKANARNILKHTFNIGSSDKNDSGTTSPKDLQKSFSSASIVRDEVAAPKFYVGNNMVLNNVPKITTEDVDAVQQASFDGMTNINETVEIDSDSKEGEPHTWTTMTPHEISLWIDKRSRLVFPSAFLLFNIFYWSFVHIV